MRLSYSILRSAYSGDLIDLRNGVWSNGGYTGQQVRLMLLPTLNTHGSFNSEDYAGPTSALKCHIGVVDFNGAGSTTLHGVGSNAPISPAAMGESVGHLITQLLSPTFYMTCAEYTGYRSRTHPTAAWTRTVGLCADPVTLDYWMCKYVMYPCATNQAFMNPDNDFNLRRALLEGTNKTPHARTLLSIPRRSASAASNSSNAKNRIMVAHWPGRESASTMPMTIMTPPATATTDRMATVP